MRLILTELELLTCDMAILEHYIRFLSGCPYWSVGVDLYFRDETHNIFKQGVPLEKGLRPFSILSPLQPAKCSECTKRLLSEAVLVDYRYPHLAPGGPCGEGAKPLLSLIPFPAGKNSVSDYVPGWEGARG